MNRISRIVTALVVCVASSNGAWAQTSFPMVASTYPTGGQRGKTVDIAVNGADGTGAAGRNFYGASKVLFQGRGLSAVVVPLNPEPKASAPNTIPTVNPLTLRVTVAADAELGLHEFRVLTPRGVSSVGLFVVGDEPEVNEVEPNDTIAKAQTIAIPATVNGKIQSAEDVDCFKFKVEAGQTVAFHVLSGRLQDKMHDLQAHVDPMITVLDLNGRELASNDDFFKADPYLVHTFAEGGEFIAQIRDVRYQGNAHWVYRLTITNKPYLTAVYPMGVQRGQSCEVELVGTGMGGMKKTQVQIGDMSPGKQLIQVPTPNGMTNPVPVYVSELPQVVSGGDNHSLPTATPIEIPCVANGRIDKDGDRDYFQFSAKKGQAFNFQVMARQLESLLDSFLSVVNADGRELVSNDDANVAGRLNTPDSAIIGWTAPADGDYCLVIRDLHNRGGDNFGYLIVCKPQEQDFALRLDPDKAMIGPGGYYPMFVMLDRLGGFAGDVQVVIEGLPKGVTATPLTIPAGLTTGVTILHAAADAPLDAANVQVIGIASVQREGAAKELRHVATPMQEIYFPGGGRGNYPIDLATVSVTLPQDILVEIDKQELTLTQGGSATINVKIKRNNYTKPVSVDCIIRHLNTIYCNPLPTGVTMDLKIIGDNQDTTQIVIKAADNATPIKNWPISVMGQVSINFVVKTSYSSAPLMLTVTPKKNP